MASGLQIVRSPITMRERLIVALDVDDLDTARRWVALLANEVGMFKIGKQLFTHSGPAAVRLIRELGGEVFLDLKFHDIPNTVAKAAAQATRLGVKMFNVHASGSLTMMRQTTKEIGRVCRQENLRRPIMLAVTVLTSLDKSDLEKVGVGGEVADQVTRLALLTKEAGMDGVVAAPPEVAGIRAACGKRFIIVAAGIRPAGGRRNDQKRVMTPQQAIASGVDYIVVGRPILEARDPIHAVRELILDMEQGGAKR